MHLFEDIQPGFANHAREQLNYSILSSLGTSLKLILKKSRAYFSIGSRIHFFKSALCANVTVM